MGTENLNKKTILTVVAAVFMILSVAIVLPLSPKAISPSVLAWAPAITEHVKIEAKHTGSEPYWRAILMRNRRDNLDFSVPDPELKRQRFKTLRHDPQLLYIKQQLLTLNLWENPSIQHKYRLAKLGTEKTQQKVRVELLQIIEDCKVRTMELDDPYMPYASADQISNDCSGIHILGQANNNIPLYADPYSYCLLWLILGPQGGGKTSAVFYQLSQIGVPRLLLDPKGTWEFRADQLQAEVVPPQHLRFSFNCDEDKLPMYLHSIMEGVAYATGLQYGLSCLYEACDIALEQRRRFVQQTGQPTSLCLKDVRLALDLCDTKNPKWAQYLESARTALDMLLGRNDLFTTRSGLPLDDLFQSSYILQCRYLTTAQSRFLGWFLLNYLYFESLGKPETTQLRSLIVFEDSSKFVSKPDTVFGSGPKTSVFLHLLSVLRSTGRGAIFVDQLVEPICDDVKQLCNNWLVVGSMRGTHNQSEVASAMGLTQDQAAMLGRLQCREAVCFCPTTYPYAIHGFIPEVPEPRRSNTDE